MISGGYRAADMPAAQQVASLLRSRRSVGKFLPDKPADDIIEQALELACWAPNHHLTEPWRFYLPGPQAQAAIVERNAQLVAARKGDTIADNKRQRWSAVPGWLVVTCQRSDNALRAREDYAACCCAIQNLMLSLGSHGIASKWTTGAVTRDDVFYDILAIDRAAEDVVSLLWYGYPDSQPLSRRTDAAELTTRLP